MSRPSALSDSSRLCWASHPGGCGPTVARVFSVRPYASVAILPAWHLAVGRPIHHLRQTGPSYPLIMQYKTRPQIAGARLLEADLVLPWPSHAVFEFLRGVTFFADALTDRAFGYCNFPVVNTFQIIHRSPGSAAKRGAQTG